MSSTTSKPPSNQTAKELFAGCVGGIVQVLSGQPFDTVKVRLQTQPDRYKSLLDCVKSTYTNEGVLGFYKGTLTPLIGIGACVSIQFGALEAAKRFFVQRNKGNKTLSYADLYLSGSFSGIANSVLSGPIEHVRTRLQTQTSATAEGAYKGPLDFARRVVNSHGVFRGLYKGQGITLLREFHGYGIYFLTYEALMQRQMKIQGTEKRGDVAAWRQCVFGAMSGYTLWIMIYPIDSIKSKLQTDAFEPSKQKYSSTLDCARKVLKAEGMGGFYRGFWACMLRAGPVNGVTFVAYEWRLRCRSSKGQTAIGASLTAQSSLLDLKCDIESSVSIPASKMTSNVIHLKLGCRWAPHAEYLHNGYVVKTGFPPKVLSAPDSATLESIGIRDGDQILVEFSESASLAPAADSPIINSSSNNKSTTTPSLPPSRAMDVQKTVNAGRGSGSVQSVPVKDGMVVVRTMEDDNSCLFRSVGYVLERSVDVAPKLRQVIANAILQNPFDYNEAILGKSIESYTSWIQKPNSWGGAIELAIFADHYKTEICSIDVANLRADRFGEGKGYERRVVVMYTGIHYDAVVVTPAEGAPQEFDVTSFDVADGDEVLDAAVRLASVLKQQKKFTDLANFTLKCGICAKGLKGQKEAQAHAMETGHAQFTEYS
ncbi:Mitochondrial carrier protein ymc2 [Chytridiales sp. JEL 0842]|nr:Mitochondrial carrier protein ymc2 [Chytridiales sp. JEL 0842]